MLWILALIIILYVSSYIFFGKNQTFLKVRKWVDIATLVVIPVLVIAWIKVFHYSFYFIIYFFISFSIIIGLILRIRKLEKKKKRAEEKIVLLKDKEELLEENLREITDDQN